MVLEQATLHVKPNTFTDFEFAFKKATSIICKMKGFISVELLKCVEKKDTYLLLVKWDTIDDHEIGFRKSNEYQEWKKLLHHFYEPFPKVWHYKSVITK